MDIKQVTGKIISEAEAQAAKIKAECDEKLASYSRQTSDLIDKYDAQSREMADKAAAEEKTRILATARMKSRSAILSRKREILGELDRKVSEKLSVISAEDFISLTVLHLKTLALKGNEVIMPGKNEVLADDKWLAEVNKVLGTSLTLGPKANFSRGLSVVCGNVSVNLSFDILIEIAKAALEEEITSRLFAQ